MKFRKIELLVMIVLILEFIACFLMLNHLTIFQYMLFVQVVPSVLLATIAGNIAARSKYTWLILVVFGLIHMLMMFAILRVTPMTLIEKNTIQSETSVFAFNRNLRLGTYFGFFLQEFLLGAFIATIVKTFRRIKQGTF